VDRAEKRVFNFLSLTHGIAQCYIQRAFVNHMPTNILYGSQLSQGFFYEPGFRQS
jgi:hypothetical protein